MSKERLLSVREIIAARASLGFFDGEIDLKYIATPSLVRDDLVAKGFIVTIHGEGSHAILAIQWGCLNFRSSSGLALQEARQLEVKAYQVCMENLRPYTDLISMVMRGTDSAHFTYIKRITWDGSLTADGKAIHLFSHDPCRIFLRVTFPIHYRFSCNADLLYRTRLNNWLVQQGFKFTYSLQDDPSKSYILHVHRSP